MNKQSVPGVVLSALLLSPATSVWAHPGHGDDTVLLGLLHLFEPVHLLPVFAVVVAGVALRRLRRPARGSRDTNRPRGGKPHTAQD